MRVGIDASNLRSGGGITHLVELLRVAEPSIHGIEQVVVWAGRELLEELPPGLPWLIPAYEPVLDLPLPFRLYWQRVRLSRLARSMCDLLFVPGGLYLGDFRPYVTMSRNLLPFEPSERRRFGFSWQLLRLLLLRRAQASSFRNADGVIFLSEYARSKVMSSVKRLRGRWTVIPHGIDERFRLPPRPQKPIDSYSPLMPYKLLYVSAVDVYKHQWHTVQSAAKLRQSGLPVELTLVGSAYPPALRRLRRIIEQVDPFGTFINYAGHESYSLLPKRYHQADCFVFASSCENLPNILLEAMAAGLPIACSERGPMPEILGDAGVYFDPESTESISVGLRRLIEGLSLRESSAQLAYEKAGFYSWKRCARETFEFLAGTARQADCPEVS